MYEVLKQHATETVWCSPEQDNQIILKPVRITKPQGALISFEHMMRSLTLPTKSQRYHVFSIGHAHPVVLGLLPKKPDWTLEGWTLFSTAVETNTLYCDLYTDAGIHVPLHRSYYMYTNDRALIIAVEAGSGSPIDYTTEPLYLRLYTNAYFETPEGLSLMTDTRALGGTIYTRDDIVTYQTQLATWATLPGRSLCFINGKYVDTISLVTTKIGDVVEIVHDTSIKAVVDLPVATALTFTSTLDSCYKYLLHPPKDAESVVNFYDDVDIYLVHTTATGEIGHYYHRNTVHSVRMVTHRDYSIPVDHYEAIAQALSDGLGGAPLDLRGLTIRVFIRKAGITRPLIHEHHRLFELYKLKDSAVLGAMVGDEATMPYWTADALEQSAYTTLMRCHYQDITIDLINEAYGYNSITQVIGDTPSVVRPYGTTGIVSLPPVLQVNATMYEYDTDGVLLGFYPHTASDVYETKHAATTLVEGIVGKGLPTLLKSTGPNLLPIPTAYSYRVYMCYCVNGVPNHQWTDVTGSAYYTIENGLLKWTGLENDQWLEIRRDESFLAYTTEVAPVNGVLFFSLTELIAGENELLSIPLGDLDLWLNGHALIENLDYRVEFPKVTLLNKEFLMKPVVSSTQQVTVRFTGFCSKTLTWKPAEDYGFIEHGVLSNNSRFDVRDDKVLRITVGGSYRNRTDLIFSEEHQGVSIVNTLNGKPYQVKDVVVPLRTLTDDETYALRALSVEVDTAVEAYMTRFLPQPPREGVMAISSRWAVYSPFFARILSDIVTGLLESTLFDAMLGDTEVLTICKPYETYLDVDPINTAFDTRFAYVAVHPTALDTPVAISRNAYRFMQRVVALYGRNVISLNSHVTIGLGG